MRTECFEALQKQRARFGPSNTSICFRKLAADLFKAIQLWFINVVLVALICDMLAMRLHL